MHECRFDLAALHRGRKAPEAPPVVRPDRLGPLRLDQAESASPPDDHEVHFEALLVAEEVELTRSAAILLALDHPGGDEALEHRPEERGAGELPVGIDPEEDADQPRIDPVDLRRLDETLPQVLEEGDPCGWLGLSSPAI